MAQIQGSKGEEMSPFPLFLLDMAVYSYLLSHTFFIRTDDVG